MQSAERRQLRAYVGIEDISFEVMSKADPDYQPADLASSGYVRRDFIVTKTRNFGLTPAYRVTVFAYLVDTEFPNRLAADYFAQNDQDVFPTGKIRAAVTRALVQRGQSEIIKSALRDIRVIQQARDKERQIFIYGRVYYYDAYDRPWRTRFCYAWEPWHPAGERFVPYEYHNDEDQKRLLNADGNPV